MDRDTFSNNRRDRHFGRANQNFPNFVRNNNRGDHDMNNNFSTKRTLRETYLRENREGSQLQNEFFCGGHLPFVPAANPFLLQAENFRSMTPPASEQDFLRETADLSFQFNSLGLDGNSNGRPSPHDSPNKYMRINRLSSLPLWTLDENREIRSDLTLKKVVEEGLILLFAMDKSGCHFLQSNYYGVNTQNVDPLLRNRIGREVLGSREIFLTICKNIFGNFFLQRVIEFSNETEQEIIKKYIVSDINALCLDKSACRVVQTALEKLDTRFSDAIVAALPRKHRLMTICTDQNANHVIQKVVKKMPLSKWEFLVSYLCKTEHDNLLDVCQDKYGCRVVQTIVEVLSSGHDLQSMDSSQQESEEKLRVLRKLMARILAKCQKLASNEFANYVIQHIIETPGVLSDYRNAIIENCLLRNLLSMSQEKYASHVVERAFCFAPLPHVAEMMEEIFDGYVPHPDTGKDALDILIFHQFGNYVVQRMLEICCSSVIGKRETVMADGVNCRDKFEGWLNKLYLRARKERTRLTRFSSGKKILEILENLEKSYKFTPSFDCSPYPPCPSSSISHESIPSVSMSALFSPTNTASVEWASRKTSLASSTHDFDFGFNFAPPKF